MRRVALDLHQEGRQVPLNGIRKLPVPAIIRQLVQEFSQRGFRRQGEPSESKCRWRRRSLANRIDQPRIRKHRVSRRHLRSNLGGDGVTASNQDAFSIRCQSDAVADAALELLDSDNSRSFWSARRLRLACQCPLRDQRSRVPVSSAAGPLMRSGSADCQSRINKFCPEVCPAGQRQPRCLCQPEQRPKPGQ